MTQIPHPPLPTTIPCHVRVVRDHWNPPPTAPQALIGAIEAAGGASLTQLPHGVFVSPGVFEDALIRELGARGTWQGAPDRHAFLREGILELDSEVIHLRLHGDTALMWWESGMLQLACVLPGRVVAELALPGFWRV